jgi:hypothetical protein
MRPHIKEAGCLRPDSLRPAGQRGQAIVLIALMLGVVVGMAALAIDGSRAFALRRDMQAAVDAAVLAAGDNLQRSGSYPAAEQAATSAFGTNLRLYSAPACSAYGSPGASPYTVTCTYSDGTVLTDAASALGPAGSQFALTASRTLDLQFGRVLTNGVAPRLSAVSAGGVNNQLYAPTLAALSQAGCGGAGGTALSIGGAGTLSVSGDMVSSGSITVTSGSARVAGDIYARCQSSVAGAVTVCYPSGANPTCTFPDVLGTTKSGYRFVDPNYPAPAVVGGSQGAQGSNVVLAAGQYSANPNFGSGRCWFLSAGVYDWLSGYTNSDDLVSNELKPPSEPQTNNNTTVSPFQFWNTNGVNCAGAFQATSIDVPNPLPQGRWGVELTSVRNDSYAGNSYLRESAPSYCDVVDVKSGDAIQVQVSNVPGATSYNVYVSLAGNGCTGPWGLVGNIPVVGTVSNSNTNPCPAFQGNGCRLGHETAVFDSTIITALFAPNPLAAPGTPGAYPPNGELAPLAANLPNQNPARGPGAAGDRANENNCESVAGVYVSCPAAITPGAVVFYLPGGACLTTTNFGDTYVFSGYQYNWMAVFEPPANTCPNTLGANGNSAYVGLVYTPAASIAVPSSYSFEVGGTGGVIANTITFTGSLPAINFSSAYAPVPSATRLVS